MNTYAFLDGVNPQIFVEANTYQQALASPELSKLIIIDQKVVRVSTALDPEKNLYGFTFDFQIKFVNTLTPLKERYHNVNDAIYEAEHNMDVCKRTWDQYRNEGRELFGGFIHLEMYHAWYTVFDIAHDYNKELKARELCSDDDYEEVDF